MHKSLKILHTEWSQGWGGQEIRIIAEIQAFRERGYSVTLACREDSQIYLKAKEKEIQTHLIPFNFPLNPFTMIRLARFFQKENFDIIHTHSSIDSWNSALTSLFTGHVVVRSRHLSAPVKNNWTSRLLYNQIPRAVITSGQQIRDHLIQDVGCDSDKIVSIPAGADETRFHPNYDKKEIRHQLKLQEEDYVVGIVAVLRSWKGHHILIEAINQLVSKIPRLKLLIVGDGPVRQKTEEQVRQLNLQDHTLFTGHRTDVPQMMKAMDLFILPSLKNEATSQVIPQAMLVGIPVISSSAGGLTEVVRSNETGRVVPPDDSESLRNSIFEAFSEKEETQRMKENALSHAKQNFTFTTMIDRTADVYQSCVKI